MGEDRSHQQHTLFSCSGFASTRMPVVGDLLRLVDVRGVGQTNNVALLYFDTNHRLCAATVGGEVSGDPTVGSLADPSFRPHTISTLWNDDNTVVYAAHLSREGSGEFFDSSFCRRYLDGEVPPDYLTTFGWDFLGSKPVHPTRAVTRMIVEDRMGKLRPVSIESCEIPASLFCGIAGYF